MSATKKPTVKIKLLVAIISHAEADAVLKIQTIRQMPRIGMPTVIEVNSARKLN